MTDLSPDPADELAMFLRALMDTERLQIAGLLARKPRTAESLAAELELALGQRYSEKEINAVLARYHNEVAALRRYLVDYGYVRRTTAGQEYWLAGA